MRTANENKTFSVLAGRVDHALQTYRDTEQRCEDAKRELRRADADRSSARIALDKARDELFTAHPELQPVARPVIVNDPVSDGGFRSVEVDDPDDVPDFRETS